MTEEKDKYTNTYSHQIYIEGPPTEGSNVNTTEAITLNIPSVLESECQMHYILFEEYFQDREGKNKIVKLTLTEEWFQRLNHLRVLGYWVEKHREAIRIALEEAGSGNYIGPTEEDLVEKAREEFRRNFK